jgi:hypothetical protein
VNQRGPATPVVVGIDGSQAAVDAALWAADEAISTGGPLRLVHAISIAEDFDPDLDDDPAELARDWPETEYGLQSLAAASTAVLATGRPITVQTQILWGEVDTMPSHLSSCSTDRCHDVPSTAPGVHRPADRPRSSRRRTGPGDSGTAPPESAITPSILGARRALSTRTRAGQLVRRARGPVSRTASSRPGVPPLRPAGDVASQAADRR